jgi:hypothetical protein
MILGWVGVVADGEGKCGAGTRPVGTGESLDRFGHVRGSLNLHPTGGRAGQPLVSLRRRWSDGDALPDGSRWMPLEVWGVAWPIGRPDLAVYVRIGMARGRPVTELRADVHLRTYWGVNNGDLVEVKVGDA